MNQFSDRPGVGINQKTVIFTFFLHYRRNVLTRKRAMSQLIRFVKYNNIAQYLQNIRNRNNIVFVVNNNIIAL